MRGQIILLGLIMGMGTPTFAQTPKSVGVEPLRAIASYPQRSAPATVTSLNQPEVSAQIGARLETIPVRVGDRVSAGETLAQMDCREYELAHRSARAQTANIEARLRLAQSRLDRAESLITNQLLSQDDLDSRQTELRALEADLQDARARLELAELNVERCTIRSPFDALVLERVAQSGQWLATGSPVVKLLDLSRVEIIAQIFAADARLISSATEFQLEANGETYPVQLRTLVDAIDPTTRNRDARFEFVDGESLIGSAGKILWSDPRPHLPPELLVDRNGQLGFFVLRGNRAEFVPLANAQPGRSNPVDLELQTLVVTDGYLGLTQGETVNQRATD